MLISSYDSPSILYRYASIPASKDKNFQIHMHDICELIYIKSGDVSAIIGEKTYKLKKGSLVIFRANIPHRIRIDGDGVYERHNILFDENTLAGGAFLKLPKTLDVLDCDASDIMPELFSKLKFYISHFEGDALDILMRAVVEELILNFHLVAESGTSASQLTVQPLIGSAITYINAHYTEPITVEDICAHLNITKSYLHQLFIKEMKISPKRYVNMRRLARAQKLIRRGERPSSVYVDCGFGEYATFFRNYINYFGHTPSQENDLPPDRKIES